MEDKNSPIIIANDNGVKAGYTTVLQLYGAIGGTPQNLDTG